MKQRRYAGLVVCLFLLFFGSTRPGLAGTQEEYQSLLKEYETAQQDFYKVYRGARTEGDKNEAFANYSRNEKYTGRFLSFAEKNPKDPYAFYALSWIVMHAPGDPNYEKALTLLIDSYLLNDSIGSVCEYVAQTPTPTSEKLLHGILEKNPRRDARGLAAFGLGKFLENQCALVQKLKTTKSDEQLREAERILGKDAVKQLQQKDPAKISMEIEKMFELVIEKYGEVNARDRTLADRAKGELFEVRNLSVGRVAPEIEGQDVEGQTFKLSDYRGKVIVLDFWGDWCGPCRDMYPHQRSLVKRVKDKSFAILGINSDTKDHLRKAVKRENMTWRSWWDGGSPNGPIARQWNIPVWPTTYVLDHKGVIRFKGVREKDMDEAVDTLVQELEAGK